MTQQNQQLSSTLVKEVEQALGVDISNVNTDGFAKNAVKCPMVNHENDDHSPAAFWHVEKHFLHCHKCGKSYNTHEVAVALGIDPKSYYKTHEIKTTKRVYSGIQDYAEAHGLTVDDLHACGWRETTYSGHLALQYPTASGDRWRILDVTKNTYRSQKGYQSCWYLLSAKNLLPLIEQGQPLVICNGEVSTIVGRKYGVATLAFTSGEKPEIPPGLMQQLKGVVPKGTKIIVAGDCDAAGRRFSHGLKKQLVEEGYPTRAVDMKLSDGGDVADFCMLHGWYSVEALEACADLPDEVPEDDDTTWKFMSIDQVLQMQPIEWLIKGMIPKRGLSIIYGESGTFKSFFALDQALRVGLNHNVIYVAAEGENGYRQRIEAWFKHFGKCKPKLHFVMGSIDLFQDDELYIFSKEAERRDPRMMVIDTMSMNIGGADTNNGRDMVKVFQSCKRLAKHLNCAIVLVHHTNAEGRRATGSQRIKDSSDTMIRLSRVDDSIAVECKKTKDSSPFKTIYLKEVPVMLGYNDQYGNPRTSLVLMPSAKVIRESTLTELQEKVLSYLVDTPEASQRQLADDIEEKFPSVQSAMKALRKKGYLNREGKEWRVTKEGMQSLGEGEPSEPHELTEPSEVTISSNGNGVHSEHSPHLLDSEHPETQEAMPGFEPLSKEAVEYPM